MKERKQYHKKEIIWQEKIRKQLGHHQKERDSFRVFHVEIYIYIYISQHEYRSQHEIFYSSFSTASSSSSFYADFILI
jgi:hypothetical protein